MDRLLRCAECEEGETEQWELEVPQRRLPRLLDVALALCGCAALILLGGATWLGAARGPMLLGDRKDPLVKHLTAKYQNATTATAPCSCQPAFGEITCLHEVDNPSLCWRWCCKHARLQNTVKLRFWTPKMKEMRWERCALVGSGDDMRGAGRGALIDSHNPVIRIKRIPNPEFFADFGKRTDIIFANDMFIDEGRVALMRGGFPARCGAIAACSASALVFRRLAGESPTMDCPKNLKDVWGTSHPFLGCTPDHVNTLAGEIEGMGGQPSTGFVAFLTFVPLCQKMDVYGFPLNSRATTDGHVEFDKHPLEAEHMIERLIARLAAASSSAKPKLKGHWQQKEWKWFLQHVGEVRFVGDRSN